MMKGLQGCRGFLVCNPPLLAGPAPQRLLPSEDLPERVQPKPGRRQELCYFTDTPSPSLLKRLLMGEGGRSRMAVSPTGLAPVHVGRRDLATRSGQLRPPPDQRVHGLQGMAHVLSYSCSRDYQ